MKPKITLQQIRALASKQSYSRGENYYQRGAILHLISRGNRLEGRCEGSGYSPYHVSVALDDEGTIEDASCTCDYAYDGVCKHIVALLLTYFHNANAIQELPPLDVTLAQRSPEELIALIQQMVERYPDLQLLVDRPTPSSLPAGKVVDLALLRAELQNALRVAENWEEHEYWEDENQEDGAHVTATVVSIASTARTFADAGRWHDASAIYRTILEECATTSRYIAYDDGELTDTLNSVIEEVVKCLGQSEISTNDEERQALLQSLLSIFIWNIEAGGQGTGVGVLPDALLQHAHPQDLPDLRQRTSEAQLRLRQQRHKDSGVEACERVLLQLDAREGVDPEVTLQRLRKNGLYHLLFDNLLELGRIDEAIKIAAKEPLNSSQQMRAIDKLATVGRTTAAIDLAKSFLQEKFDPSLVKWLVRHYEASGDHNALFEIRMLSALQNPTLTSYFELKESAEALGKWATVRPELLHKLRDSKHLAELASIYLHDEEWDAAWETVDMMEQRRGQPYFVFNAKSLELEVAHQSQHARPHKSINVFLKYAHQDIEARNREQYRSAAAYLTQVRDLYRQIDGEQSWRELIAAIRDKFSKLRALQEELKKAGL